MKKILVTGCNGQLGRAIRKEYAEQNIEFINTDVVAGDGIVSLDITNIDVVMNMVKDAKPDVIINCAAHTNVDKCEEQEDLAYKINAIGPRNLSIAATEVDAKMIHISTDYVFEGNGTRPYIEFDKPNPISAYGRTKLEGENFVKQFASRFFMLRTAWLYGDGRNFVKTMLSLSEKHDELNVVCDQLGSPTSAVELAKMIHFLEGTDNYGIFHATCEGDTNWAEFADEIMKQAGKKTRINHVTSKQYKEMNPASANRPAYSILENYMIKLTSDYRMADWQDALTVYMKELLG
ncbi:MULTISPECIES: dTDP-4-dehydrorhamnose reductase [unclassified Roseburia]|jgi:dTDP-4-dehydrorhamnose reductase|uniref:dTDP-4-dehydrorhamnose reductase n=1 Tax=unclassified Roseburia TaxID=2637578 RepID=UPI000E43CF84|nr:MULTISPECIES: dTDP-4-dehydrorhamnose reductase [unclassified Roseburia]RGF44310.1 dTDP-4-dehydrorhamnose reductase [Roseburia sp. AF42-8]RGG49885.1 dTDP-4-dehydrorhamnose reductase [Roseburia sp. AF20-18LB]RGI46441.1 dTDP-4-dehydrorhamnose reductase [Roseburia sp. OM04-10BH]RHQ41097.1 dTDP-4-dehydrorhamnose reductase [Roseburia sp. AF25-25LB]RHQ42877.1 dTDP-4-dehydrorhamnose reductase [Roseburia sp. AF25-18LB]